MRIWIDNIEFPKVETTTKESAGREFLQGEITVYYTAYKDGNHLWHGEFKCSKPNVIDLDALNHRILSDLKADTLLP